MEKTRDRHIKILEGLFPDKEIKNFSNTNGYERLCKYCYRNDIDLGEYIQSLGFVVPPNLQGLRKFIQTKMKVHFPDNKIEYIQEIKNKDKKLYDSIKTYERHYKFESPAAVLKDCGIELSTEFTLNRIEELHAISLKELYPDKQVSKLFTINKLLYRRVKYYADTNQMKLDEYLKKLGFTYIKAGDNID